MPVRATRLIRAHAGKGQGPHAARSPPRAAAQRKFAARGSQLKVSLNDETIIKTNDARFARGYIGLRIYGDSKIPCDGTFSNLTVR